MLQTASTDTKKATARGNAQPPSATDGLLSPPVSVFGNQAALRLHRKCDGDRGDGTRKQDGPGTALHRKPSGSGKLETANLLDQPTHSFFEARLQRKASPPATEPGGTRLHIGAVDDPLEFEADAAADRVMRMPDPIRAGAASAGMVQHRQAGLTIQPRTDPGAAGILRRAPIPGWNFTPADYAKLLAAGKTLTMASDSSWFPAQLQQNLMNTLKFLLGPQPAGQPVPTEGVNAMDLFHGHLVVKKNPAVKTNVDAALQESGKIDQQLKTAQTQSMGKLRYDSPKPPSAQQIGDYKQATDKILPSLTNLFNQIQAIPGAALMYHTYEFNNPSDLKAAGQKLGDDDPRRQCVTPLDTNTPAQYTSPKGATYEADYYSIAKFSFLVDSAGAVHVRPFNTGGLFTTLDLSAITGTPYKDDLPNERK